MHKRIVVSGLLVLLGVFLVIVISLTLISQLHQHQIQGIANTFVGDVIAGDAANSYQLLTPDSQTKNSQDNWTQTVTKLSAAFKGQRPRLQKVSVINSFAFVNYTISAADGTYILKTSLTQVNKKWLVQSFVSQLAAS